MIVIDGQCFICGKWSRLSRHHLGYVKDFMENVYRGMTLRESKNRERRLRREGNHGMMVMLCGDCHKEVHKK